LPLTVQGNRVTAWRPKGINCFGLERGNGCRQGLRALCGRKSPPPCTSAEGPRCLYKCAWLSHAPTGRPWPRTTAVAGSTTPSCSLLLAAFELENIHHCQHRSTLRPSRLEPLTVGITNRGSTFNRFGRTASWCAPLSVACAAPLVTARCSQARILANAVHGNRSDPSMARACHSAGRP
jgi:hypothetical protein